MVRQKRMEISRVCCVPHVEWLKNIYSKERSLLRTCLLSSYLTFVTSFCGSRRTQRGGHRCIACSRWSESVQGFELQQQKTSLREGSQRRSLNPSSITSRLMLFFHASHMRKNSSDLPSPRKVVSDSWIHNRFMKQQHWRNKLASSHLMIPSCALW